MKVTVTVNGRKIQEEIECDLLLIDFLRSHGCMSVKRGCETSNCGLCTVMMDGRPVLSCSVLTARADGHTIETLEGTSGGSGGVRRIYRRSGRGTVRFLQPRFYDERPGSVPGES